MIREQFRDQVVPLLVRNEIGPLQCFFPDKSGLTVLDIGANKGLWTRALLDVFGSRIDHVYLFDPSLENYRELQNHDDSLAGFAGADFERLTVYCCALGREPGMAALYTNEDGSPLGSLYPHASAGWGARMKDIRLSERVDIRMDTVDDVVARNPITKVDIMKIDTEGHEMDVLLGRSGRLPRSASG